MNGLDNIIEKIKSDAETIANHTLSEAKSEADKITAEFDAKAESEGAAVLQAGTEQAREIESRAVSIAHLEVRKKLLAKKQELIAATFEGAQKRLLELNDTDYADLLCKLAVDNSVSGAEEVVLNTRDHEQFGSQIVASANEKLQALNRPHTLTLSSETRDFEGGLFLKDGNVETNCRLSAIVAFMKEELTREVAGILFS